MDFKGIIKKYALQNAIKYGGKANIGAVIGHILAQDPNLKNKIKEISVEVKNIVNEVNRLSLDKQKEELEKSAPELLKEKKHAKKHLPNLKNAIKGKVVMRFEPSPSGPLHIGHAYVLGLNSEYCRIYNGKLILRIGDTNPENIYEPAYKLIEEDAKWVTKNNVNKVIIQSNRLKIYYGYMEKLIKKGNAYVCTCKPSEFKEKIIKSMPCPCRELSIEENSERWKKMFSSYKEGEAVVRIKTNIEDKNPAMRDFPVFRINDHKHPRQGKKYRVWPLMNMAVAVDDIELGVTHVIRAKDHYDNALRQRFIYNYLNKKFPEALFVGRINFTDLKVSCSKTRPLIEKGLYSGWDDIRLPFLPALRRRGYQPDAFIKYTLDVGMSLNDKTVSGEEFFKTINAFNKEIIDHKAYRYFFIANPKEIVIENAPKQTVELDLHPDNKKGGRHFKTNDKFYITKQDYKSLKGNRLYRLMDCLNFYKKKNKFIFDSLEYKKYKEKGTAIIHWLPKEKDLINVNILMPDNKLKKGLGEGNLKNIKVDDIVQLQRFGFCKVDKKEKNKLTFWFTHR